MNLTTSQPHQHPQRLAAAGVLLLALAACSPSGTDMTSSASASESAARKERPTYRENPQPKQAYRITMTIENAPGPFASMTALAQYDVVNKECLRPPKDNPEPSHPANGKCRQAYTGVVEIDRTFGRTPDGVSERLAASLTAAGPPVLDRRGGLEPHGRRAFALDVGPAETRRRVHVDVAEAVQHPVEASTVDWQTATEKLAVQQEQQSRERNIPAMQGPAMT